MHASVWETKPSPSFQFHVTSRHVMSRHVNTTPSTVSTDMISQRVGLARPTPRVSLLFPGIRVTNVFSFCLSVGVSCKVGVGVGVFAREGVHSLLCACAGVRTKIHTRARAHTHTQIRTHTHTHTPNTHSLANCFDFRSQKALTPRSKQLSKQSLTQNPKPLRRHKSVMYSIGGSLVFQV